MKKGRREVLRERKRERERETDQDQTDLLSVRRTGLLQLEHSPQEYALTPQAVGAHTTSTGEGVSNDTLYIRTEYYQSNIHHLPSKRASIPTLCSPETRSSSPIRVQHARVVCESTCMYMYMHACICVTLVSYSLADMPHDTVLGLPYNHQWFAVPSHVLTEPVDSSDQVG